MTGSITWHIQLGHSTVALRGRAPLEHRQTVAASKHRRSSFAGPPPENSGLGASDGSNVCLGSFSIHHMDIHGLCKSIPFYSCGSESSTSWICGYWNSMDVEFRCDHSKYQLNLLDGKHMDPFDETSPIFCVRFDREGSELSATLRWSASLVFVSGTFHIVDTIYIYLQYMHNVS